MAAQYELLKELLNSGTKLSFGQDFFFKFYQAFLLKDRWMQYINGVGTTLLVTALALALGVESLDALTRRIGADRREAASAPASAVIPAAGFTRSGFPAARYLQDLIFCAAYLSLRLFLLFFVKSLIVLIK